MQITLGISFCQKNENCQKALSKLESVLTDQEKKFEINREPILRRKTNEQINLAFANYSLLV